MSGEKVSASSIVAPEAIVLPGPDEIGTSLVLGSGLSSRLISWYGQGYGGYSHADALMRDGTRLGARSDAVKLQSGEIIPPGVRVRPENYEKWKARCDIILKVGKERADQAEDWLRSQIGQGYDRADILGLIFGIPLMTQGHWICSALITARDHLIKIFPDMPQTPQQVPPNMVLFGELAVGGRISYRY